MRICSILTIFFLLAISPVVYAQDTEPVSITLPNQTIDLYEPIQITDVQIFQDGGTKAITLTDGKGKTFSFCLDGRLRASSAPNIAPPSEPYHIYANATYPTSDGASELLIGGVEEKSILKVMQFLVNREFTVAEQQAILSAPASKDNYKLHVVLEVMKVMEER